MKNALKSIRWFNETAKVLVWFTVLNGEAQIWYSYRMARIGVTEPLENLSITIVTQIIAPIAMFLITNTVQNVFEKNDIFNKTEVENAECN